MANPTGKGGFQDHPELRNPGGWKKENTISYQYRRFMNMKSSELKETVEKEMKSGNWTVAMDIAYHRIVEARKSLNDVKEITDRTEGKAIQAVVNANTDDPIEEVLKKLKLVDGGADVGETEEAS